MAELTKIKVADTTYDIKDAAAQRILTAGTNITITETSEGPVISSTAADNSFRGSWSNWTNVPTDASQYPIDKHGSHIPVNGDYMVVRDTSDYVSLGDEIKIEYVNSTIKVKVTFKGISKTAGDWKYMPITMDEGHLIVRTRNSAENPAVISDKYQIIYNGTVYPVNTLVPCGNYNIYAPHDPTILNTAGESSYSGTWRFAYSGTWSTDTKNGWKPEYNVKEVLPNASSELAGISKLYDSTGSNTDGSINQNVITTQLNTKQNTITISGVLQGDGSGNITEKLIDTTVTSASTNLISSGAVYSSINDIHATVDSDGILNLF